MANEWTDELGVVRILIEYKLVTIASMVVSTHDSISHNPKEFLFVSAIYMFLFGIYLFRSHSHHKVYELCGTLTQHFPHPIAVSVNSEIALANCHQVINFQALQTMHAERIRRTMNELPLQSFVIVRTIWFGQEQQRSLHRCFFDCCAQREILIRIKLIIITL